MKTLVIGLVTFYQNYINPLTRLFWPWGVCCFLPTCSQYALDAIRGKGVLKGIILIAKRILRCNPASNGGFDPVS